MKTLTKIGQFQEETTFDKGFAVDTTFVLFFLAVDLGQNLGNFGIDSVLMTITLGLILILPYFLNSDERPNFGNWLLGRGFITLFAVTLGILFHQILGSVLPETFKFLPLTLFIVTAMLSCYIQFYSYFKVRLAK